MNARRALFALFAAAAIACASSSDGFPRDEAAAWQVAFEAGSAAHAAGRYEEADALTPRIAKLCQKHPSPVCASIPL